ncbi:glutaredoxin 2 [Legionella massiliensis]|uniref:Glutaredoxin 2 n=2 Tax=Legionella massiliensis TaxID=1034943 RepID=A0A078KVP9_9GAMM|nr:glutaredoxin 2 [Legionella massiliensis]CEE14238.1 glutaredoxin 2 [Legionella massiliensis]
MALSYANIPIEEREVDLKNKPIELIALSPKATVPVLVLGDGTIIDQSLDIIKWALGQSDPDKWLSKELEKESSELIYSNDYQFKPILDSYKYYQRAEIQDPIYYQQQAGKYLSLLNNLLIKHQYLLADRITIADIAIFPFIRQFYMVDEKWFINSEFTYLVDWLKFFLDSALFLRVMVKKS